MAASSRLRNKLLFLSGIIFLLFIVLNGTTAVITSTRLKSFLRDQGDREILQRTVDVDRQLRAVVAQKQELLNLLAGDVNLAIAIKRQRLSVLDELFTDWKKESDFLEFLLVDQAGNLISDNSAEAPVSLAGETWYQEARETGASRISFEPGEKQPPVFWLLSPLTVRNIPYALLAKVNWQTVPLFLDQSKLVQLQDSNNFFVILDGHYNPLYLPPFLHEVRDQFSTIFFSSSPSLQVLRDALLHKEIGNLHEINFVDQDNCVGFARPQNSPWLVLSFQNEEQSHGAINRIYRSSLQINLLILMAGLGILFLLIWKVAAPFQQLIAVTGEIIQGKYPDQIKIPADDEVRQIVEALNVMISQVRQQEAEVKALYEQEKEDSANLTRANELLARQSDELHLKNQEVQQAFDELRVVQEDLLQAERLAVVGETSGRVAHEVLNPVSAIMFRVENDLAKCPEIHDSLEGLREILSDWQQEMENGTLPRYFSEKGEEGVSYGAEDLSLLQGMADEFQLLNEQRQQNLQFIFKQIQRVIKIINVLRESTMTNRSVSRFPVTEPLLEALDLLADSLQKRKITVQKSIPDGLPHIDADLTEFIQVFTNLLRNAMQSIDQKQQQGGMITVDVRQNEERTIEIRIKDNGKGIPAAIQASIFEQHFTTKGKSEGTGLGLGISRRFVREYGGELILEESREGEGTTFLVTLPMVAPIPSSL
ncbi:MAG: GHKL domain-containing protein [Proteobacteria bacterium]|nr:GHKL domain-containing protein [Pseudomonadota bacterium]MBU4328561.1 GHKL domain-containing protein [Pseudomonadota bacterium]